MPVNFQSTSIPDVFLIEPPQFQDSRGSFSEIFHAGKYLEGAGIRKNFVQDNLSRSVGRVVRGMHYQLKKPQAKLIVVLSGSIYDVAVDIRVGSPTFGKWVGEVLSAENRRQIYIPEGFAHGFCVLSEAADVLYKCSGFYEPSDDFGILWSDPALKIDWRVKDPILSDKDCVHPTLEEARKKNQLPIADRLS